MLSEGADLYIESENNDNILDIALNKNHKEIVQFLVRSHPNLLKLGSKGSKQFSKLCIRMPEISKLVLQADLTVKTSKGDDCKLLDPPFYELDSK